MQRQNSPAQVGLLSILTIALASVAAVAIVDFDLASADRAHETAVLLLLLLLVPALVLRLSETRDWFHPSVFPAFYISVALIGPALYIQLSSNNLAFVTEDLLTTQVFTVLTLTVLGSLLGIRIALVVTPTTRARPRSINYLRVQTIGRAALYFALASSLSLFALKRGTVYGADQLNYRGPIAVIGSSIFIILFVAVVLLSVSSTSIRGKLLDRRDWILLTIAATAIAVTGSRAPLIGPAIFLLWAQHSLVKPLTFRSVALLTLTMLAVGQLVGATRAGGDYSAMPSSFEEMADRTLGSLASPIYVTSAVVEKVPDQQPFLGGSTYLAAIKRQLPGVLSVRLFGDPTDAAAFVFRDLTGFYNDDHGFSFALPSEGYLNFGLAGAFFAGLGLGGLLGISYRRLSYPPSRGLHLLYPIVLAAIPYGLRSDALTQIKLVMYPMLLVTLILYLSRRDGAEVPIGASTATSDRLR